MGGYKESVLLEFIGFVKELYLKAFLDEVPQEILNSVLKGTELEVALYGKRVLVRKEVLPNSLRSVDIYFEISNPGFVL